MTEILEDLMQSPSWGKNFYWSSESSYKRARGRTVQLYHVGYDSSQWWWRRKSVLAVWAHTDAGRWHTFCLNRVPQKPFHPDSHLITGLFSSVFDVNLLKKRFHLELDLLYSRFKAFLTLFNFPSLSQKPIWPVPKITIQLILKKLVILFQKIWL